MLSLTIIGAGRLGKSIGWLLANTGLVKVVNVFNRSMKSGEGAVYFIGQGKAVVNYLEHEETDLYMLAVTDDDLASVAEDLASEVNLKGKIVFHCSGAMSAKVLGEGDFSVASIHPVKNFAEPKDVIETFDGTWCGIEGDTEALSILQPLFEHIGGTCFKVASDQKVIYHAGAVFSSNFIPFIMESAFQCYQHAGIDADTARKMVELTARLTLDNVFKFGPKVATTGPVSRGDFAAVERQYEALKTEMPELASAYGQLSSDVERLLK